MLAVVSFGINNNDPKRRSILTTHTGSLPRPEKLVQLMFAKEEGQEVDPSELSLAVKQSVREVVERQLKAGIDIVNDGEVSKPSYATYIKDRLLVLGERVPR